jgi:hypothetical protein
VQHRLDRRDVGSEHVRDRREVRRRRDDRADVEVVVGPAVEPVADAVRERIVDGRVAQRALDADRRERAVGGEEPGEADDRVRAEQRERVRRIAQVQRVRDQPIAAAGPTPGPTPPSLAPSIA